MADQGLDLTGILDNTKLIKVQKRLGGNPLRCTHDVFGKKKRQIWRSHCVYMDFVKNEQPIKSELLVINRSSKEVSFYFKCSMFLLVLFVSFMLGFLFGAAFRFHLTPQRLPLTTNFKEDSDYDENLLNQDNVSLNDSLSLEETSSVLSKLIEGIYWDSSTEEFLPKGFGTGDDLHWRSFTKKSEVVRIEEGCGRMQNRLVVFRDGTKACGRYRQNTDQIQGEIFSYHLGRALRLENLVPSVLVVVNSSDSFWQSVKSQLKSSQWIDGHPVVLTEYVEDLVPARIPPTLKNFTSDIFHIYEPAELSNNDHISETVFSIQDSKHVVNIVGLIKSKEELVEMVQWSDLIIFDYLTANLDRIVNNLYNLQWNPDMLSSPAHNLARVASSDLLVFLDNESGLLHGYRLLDKYEPYHSLLLNALCVFRRSTVQALRTLRTHDALDSLLLPPTDSQDLLPTLPERNVNVLRQRLDKVLSQVNYCAQKERL